MTLRAVVFWIHLLGGAAAGLVVLNLSVTGMILAFEPQIVAFAERDVRTVTPPAPGTPRLGLAALWAAARERHPKAQLSAVAWRSDPASSVLLNLGREAGSVYVDPYTGVVLGPGSKVHDFMHDVEAWHRRLSLAPARTPEGSDGPERRPWGRVLTGAASVATFFLAASGVYLWWPWEWTSQYLRPVVFFRRGLVGRARDFNWHNVAGVWCAGLLLVSTSTGMVMSYRWANDLVYRIAGSEPPAPTPRATRSGEGRTRAGSVGAEASDLDVLRIQAERQVPGWVSISLRFTRREGDPVTASILESGAAHPNPRSSLTLDAVTGAALKWEPFGKQSAGRKVRAWIRPLHTGEAGGLAGQVLAFTGAAGTTLLVWTGLALALRRLAAWRRRRVLEAPTAVLAMRSPADAR